VVCWVQPLGGRPKAKAPSWSVVATEAL
jgi:hypothetical protein